MDAEKFNELVKKISIKANISEDEVKKLVEEKQDEFSGLVSKEGAIYMVGQEQGISLLKEKERNLKIKNLVSGLRSVDLVAKIANIYDVREFEKNGKAGKVLNFLIGDDTGLIRISFWNEEIEKVKNLQVGDVIQIKGGYVKTDYQGNLELRLGRGVLEKVEAEIKLPEFNEINTFSQPKRKNINELKDGDFAEVRACLVQLFEKNLFYEVCPNCGTRVQEKEGRFICNTHGEVKPTYQLVLSGFIDDGSENIRVVFFRNIAEKLITKTADEILQKNKTNPIKAFENFDVVGKEFIFKGRVKKSDFSGDLEFIVNDIEEVDIKKECNELIKNIVA